MTEYRVFKYYIPLINETFHLDLPTGSTILSAHTQDTAVFVYAQVPVDVTGTKRFSLLAMFTGVPFYISSNDRFIGTVESSLGLVYHVYELES